MRGAGIRAEDGGTSCDVGAPGEGEVCVGTLHIAGQRPGELLGVRALLALGVLPPGRGS